MRLVVVSPHLDDAVLCTGGGMAIARGLGNVLDVGYRWLDLPDALYHAGCDGSLYQTEELLFGPHATPRASECLPATSSPSKAWAGVSIDGLQRLHLTLPPSGHALKQRAVAAYTSQLMMLGVARLTRWTVTHL